MAETRRLTIATGDNTYGQNKGVCKTMGTRGAYGFRFEEEDKLSYNHFDSYPTGLGDEIINFVRNHSRDEMIRLFKAITLVNEDDKPDEELIKKYSEELMLAREEELASRRSTPFPVDEDLIQDMTPCHQTATDWYEALRNIQGKPEELFKVPIMTNGNEFVYDSLWCEYAYIINLDTCELEIHRGFNKSPESEGRYANNEEAYRGYYGVSLFTTIPFHKLNKIGVVSDFCEKLEEEIYAYEEGE